MEQPETEVTEPQPKRRRGSGRVFRRGSVWWVAYMASGREKRESSESDDYR
jgi:hypothetical protein